MHSNCLPSNTGLKLEQRDGPNELPFFCNWIEIANIVFSRTLELALLCVIR